MRTFTQYIKDIDHYNEVLIKIQEAKEEVIISTANFKDLQVYSDNSCISYLAVLNSMAAKNISIKIICSSPSSNFNEQLENNEELIESPNVEIKVCRRIHMKMIIIDKSLVYIGSANMTGAAFGIKKENKRNFEAGILTNDQNIISEAINHFEEAWNNNICKSCQFFSRCTGSRDLFSDKTIFQSIYPYEDFLNMLSTEQIDEIVDILRKSGYKSVKRIINNVGKHDIRIAITAIKDEKSFGICFVYGSRYCNQADAMTFYDSLMEQKFDRGIFITLDKLTDPAYYFRNDIIDYYDERNLKSFFNINKDFM